MKEAQHSTGEFVGLQDHQFVYQLNQMQTNCDKGIAYGAPAGVQSNAHF